MFRLLSSLIVVPLLITLLIAARNVLAEDSWKTVTDQDLTVSSGSALDFSAMVATGPAGKYGSAIVLSDGHIGFERRSTPERFLCASLALSPLSGGMPDKAGSERLVRELARTGYNLVRLASVDALLMTGRFKDFDFDPEQFDRLHYLLAQLKAAGIYWIVDGLTSDNAAWGDVRPHRWVKKYRTKMDVLTDPKAFAHWATLIERLWGAKNPYTGIAPMHDPAMLGMILVNEGSFFYLVEAYRPHPAKAGDGPLYPPQLAPQFRDWLKARYSNYSALRSAWGAELKDRESLDGIVDLPATVRGKGPRDIDFARFIVDVEQRAYRAMEKRVRDLGFKGLTTAFDNWSYLGADITRSSLQWVDLHSYHVLPNNHGEPGSRLVQSSLHKNTGQYIRALSNARQWGKPFTVTEYGQPFWNRWRHESAALMPAVAAHQSWDAICQFAESPIQFDYGPSPFVRRQAIYPFSVGGDPIAHAAERLAAMLYLRGDVASSQHRIHLHLDAEKVLTSSGGWEQVPEPLSKLALISPLGLDFGPIPGRPKPGELWVNLTGSQPWWLVKSANGPAAGRDLRSDAVAALQGAGLIGSGNRSRPENQLFQSDTGQLVIDSGAGIIQVVTDRTVALVLKGGNASAGTLTVGTASGPALFAVSSLDKKPIAQSRHLLLWVLTDAINTGMTFADAERTTIKTLGKFPPQVQTISATLRVASENSAGLKAWPLTLGGTRRQAIPLMRTGDAIELHVDTAALPDGPALFFEIAGE
ncbi:Beta-galactosidase [Nitrosospira sp. Nsp11]|uniref:beta-galactosidase n=1 Tax=Nitrosospira sp. Nsp11 TaxID=1855338 RepID=UPI00091FEDEA|nr:beta-galactosidase [Nitrosospira sp. Nsp11]SHM00363.1 Beta-galactosidase [Nitrosospira sp. Nsp11]